MSMLSFETFRMMIQDFMASQHFIYLDYFVKNSRDEIYGFMI